MKPILRFTLSRHHNVEIPDYNIYKYIDGDVHELVLSLLKDCVEDEAFQNEVPVSSWKQVKQSLISFWNEEIDHFETVLEIPDEDDEENYQILIYANRDKFGTNTLFSPTGELDKYENEWFSYQLVDSNRIEEIQRSLEAKTKEELIEELLIAKLQS